MLIHHHHVVTTTDEIAMLQRELELLRVRVNEIEDPTLQLPIKEKVETCYTLCSSAFCHLGEERKGYKDTIEELKFKYQNKGKAGHQMTQQKQTAPTLKLLIKELYNTAANKWEDIGILLDIEDGELAKVKADNHGDSGSCLREMLRIWLKKVNPQPSWTDLIEALIHLREEKLAQQLKERYCL